MLPQIFNFDETVIDNRWNFIKTIAREYNVVVIDYDSSISLDDDRMYKGSYSQYSDQFEIVVQWVETPSTEHYWKITNNGTIYALNDNFVYATFLHELGHCINNYSEFLFENLFEEEREAWNIAMNLDKELFKDPFVQQYVKHCLSSYQDV